MRNVASVVAIALLAWACNGSQSNSSTDQSTPRSGAGTPATGPAQHPGPDPTTANHGGGAAGTSAERSSQTVTLVGCLQGPSGGATGTSGTRSANDRSTSAARTDNATGTLGVYRLTNAAAASSDSAGVGANGAGASGGPQVTAGSSYELDGLPADAQGNVNKRVRVTGKVDARPVATGGAAGQPSAQRENATPAPGTTGATSPRDDVRANSTAVAGDSTSRRLTVETVQVVSEGCEPR